MTQITQGSLTMIGLNTPTPVVYWNGAQVPNIVGIRVDWEGDEQRVKLKTTSMDVSLATALTAAGITIKQERNHE